MAKSKVIKDLASGNVSLEIALKQLKILLVEFDKSDLLRWVNNELQGYNDAKELPKYRKLCGVLKGSFLNYTTKATNVSIPLVLDTPEDIFKSCTVVNMTAGIRAISEMFQKDAPMGMQMNSSYLPFIQQYSAISMTALLNAWVEISKSQVNDILSCVENKAMDVFLLLEREFGCLDNLDLDLTTKDQNEIEKIASQIQIIIYNDNSVTIGDNNKMKDVKVETGRFE